MSGTPTVICLRGPSGSGKTTLAEQLLVALRAAGLRVGFVKRSHHVLDVQGKDSARLAVAGAAAVVQGVDGAALFHAGGAGLPDLLKLLPSDTEVALVETFRPERYPVVLAAPLVPAEGETVLAYFDRETVHRPALLAELVTMIVALHRARTLAATPALPGAHRCAGAVLGRRLAAYAAVLLDLPLPREDRRLFVLCENDGCAADALMAATGCRPGRRTFRFSYEGKMAATFVDCESGRAVRVWARGDCRAMAMLAYPDCDPHLAQLILYGQAAPEALFAWRAVATPSLPGARRRHVLCAGCDEEIDGDAAEEIGGRMLCRSCRRSEGYPRWTPTPDATGVTMPERWNDVPQSS